MVKRQRPTGADEKFFSRTKSFVRRSRKMGEKMQAIWDEHSPRYVIEVPRETGWTSVKEGFVLNPEEVFGRRAPLVVEVGSGNGEQLVYAAQRWPEQDFIAFEVYNSGLARTVKAAAEAGVNNIRLIEADAALALPGILPPESVTEVWTFFPDPWRKARHVKRRLINPDFAAKIYQILVPGGVWRMATDWPDYAWQIRDMLLDNPHFANAYLGENPVTDDPEGDLGGFAPRWEGRTLTHFEQRAAAEGRQPRDFTAVKIDEPNSTESGTDEESAEASEK